MSKQKMKDKEQHIIQLREAGKSRQEIADTLGLTKVQIKKTDITGGRKSRQRGFQCSQRAGHGKTMH